MNVDISDGSDFSLCSQAVIKLKVLFTMNAILELSLPALWTQPPEDHSTVCGPSSSGVGLAHSPTPLSTFAKW